jgi:branched-chain amino acid transport system permease protein
MVYGILKLINFAHGEVFMVGAMLSVLLATAIGSTGGLAVLLVLVAAVLACSVLGFAIEQAAYRPLRDQPRLTSLITAIGVSLLLQFGGQGVFGPTDRVFPNIWPALGQTLSPGGVTFSYVDIAVVGLALIFMLALTWLVLYTKVGLALRAVSHDFDTAALMGVNIGRVISFTFVLGSALAAAGGLLYAIKYRTVNPLSGLMPGLKAFTAAVLGGIGNIGGAVLGAVLLGLVEALVVGYMPNGSSYRDAVAFVILIAILLVKPSGLLGKATVEKV